MTDLDPDSVSRIALLELHTGAARTLEAAAEQVAARQVAVLTSDMDLRDPVHQAAVLTAALLTVRSFGTTYLVGDECSLQAVIRRGPYRGQTMSEALRAIGVQHLVESVRAPEGASVPVAITLRGVPASPSAMHLIRADWHGWRAGVNTPSAGSGGSTATGNVIAAIAAAALAVGEAFEYLLARPGSDAGSRTLVVDLLPGAPLASSLPRFVPARWWLVGLGHLGQAYAWTLSQLPFADLGEVEVLLQDTDISSAANFSTSVLTPPRTRQAKTRLVAAALEQGGLRTRMIERRMTLATRPESTEVGALALIGVDNLATRRLLSSMGWNRVVDAGLGHRSDNFSSISMHTFPSPRRSDQVPAWLASEPSEVSLPAAFEELAQHYETCGVVDLAGKAVGVPFVGMVAAALAVAAGLADVNGWPAPVARRLDLRTSDEAFVPGPPATQADLLATTLES